MSYKYILKNSSGVVTYENDENRVLSLSLSAKKSSSVLIAADGSFRVSLSQPAA